MKLYLVNGVHPVVPTQRREATFDLEEANRHAADMVNRIVADVAEEDAAEWVEEPPLAWPDNWAAILLWCQAVRYRGHRMVFGTTFDEALEAVKALDRDQRADDADCDVWIEEIEVAAPTTVRVWHAAYDGERHGTATEAFTSEREMVDWLLEQAGKDREAFDEFCRCETAGGREASIDSFLQRVNDVLGNLDTYSWFYADIPVATPSAVAFAQSIDAEFGPIFDDDDRWSNVSGGDAVEWLGGLVEDARKVLGGQPAASPIDVAVVLEGGLVQHACVRGGAANVVVVDYDVEGTEPEKLTMIPGGADGDQVAIVSHPHVGPANAGDAFWRAVEQGA